MTIIQDDEAREDLETQPDYRKICKAPWPGLFALLGGFLIQLTLGSFYSFGNMMTYMTSYMRATSTANLTYTDFVVVQSVWGMTQGSVMPISGFLISFIGSKVAMYLGCFIFSFGTALTYFTLDQSLPYVAFSYGFVQALGQSIALIPTMTIGMQWFPDNKGVAMGVVVGGFGGGAFIFNLIQTAILNPENVQPDPESNYFTNPELLRRVPSLLLTLSGIYFSIQLMACLMITEPKKCSFVSSDDSGDKTKETPERSEDKNESSIRPIEALRYKEFYILWLTRFSVVLITQCIAAFYKAYGQTFIPDDHFLAMVGAICSIFNCSGRLAYGFYMDKTSYKLAMTTEATMLALLFLTFSFAPYFGKVMFALWVWLIFFTFPGTYSTQPAVTTQTFGHAHGGTIYGFLFTSDIVNNLLISQLSKPIKEHLGWTGFFLILSAFAVFALVITQFFPAISSPSTLKEDLKESHEIGTFERIKTGNESGGTHLNPLLPKESTV